MRAILTDEEILTLPRHTPYRSVAKLLAEKGVPLTGYDSGNWFRDAVVDVEPGEVRPTKTVKMWRRKFDRSTVYEWDE